MLNYSYEVETDGGRLVIGVMREGQLPRCADLLADTFVDTKGIQAYRRYVRRNILTYLEQHHKMPPAAVVLTAVLHSTVPFNNEGDSLMLEGSLPELLPSSSSSSSSLTAAAAGNSDAAAGAAAVADAHSSPSSSSSSSSQWGWWGKQPANNGSSESTAAPGNDTSIGSSNSGGVAVSFSSSSESKPVQGTSSHSSSSSSSSSSDRISGFVGTVVQQLATGLGLQQQQQQQTRVVQQLVGVAEVSFSESTRSAYLTLNPPRKCAYLCNMAVSNECRRKGVASHLIAAIEDMCNLAGERDVYLHLRIKDEATAGLLYTKVGFRPFKKDWPLLLLLGQEPRFLMRKQLPAARPLLGRVALPEQQQGEQQQGEQQEEEGATAGSVEREQEAAAVEAAASSAA